MITEDLDLAELTRALKAKLGPGEPVGYLRGKSVMRDILVHESGFSELEAEELVDTLEDRGYLHFRGDPTDRSRAEVSWDVKPDAEGLAT